VTKEPLGSALDEAQATEAGEEAASSPAEDLSAQLAEAEARRDEYLGDLQRVAADFDNYRKRVVQQQAELSRVVSARVVAKLLPVLDDLERALDAAEQHEETKVIEGVRLTQAALTAALASEGLTEIDAAGTFDPHVHEALLAQPVEGAEPGTIVEVVQRGYRLGDTVVRPARVIVSQ
jgi:molecular chaperone GrpE